ncbi:MAG: hypothetical protein PHI47_09400 [Sulfuricurvum sp.]|uniref:hypothetical protein n=1 Tax=Sulfuricurvum sp. TaxID=2025608 RepID=UPI002607B0E9|nr:hypothetical protein [Sulfuricurvum sp.]MDD5158681.1 hypothetical protein [Sulfuricurvum sp.]MDD5160253.1 hypothetical protein [Sulfuricurvum sp.]
MKYTVAIVLVLFIISSRAYPHDFDGRNGYIFDQSYVTRISESNASALLKIKNAGDVFLKKSKTTILPNGVKKSSDKLIFKAAGKPDLSLKSYVYKGKDDGDSQRFSYVSELGKYHLVVVEFDHDRPCFILVHKNTLKIYFVDYDSKID